MKRPFHDGARRSKEAVSRGGEEGMIDRHLLKMSKEAIFQEIISRMSDKRVKHITKLRLLLLLA